MDTPPPNQDVADVPRPALVVSIALSMISICILALFLAQRVRATRHWSSVPATNWLVFAIYVDSTFFVLLTAVLSHGWGVNSSPGACQAAILLCLVFYMTTKLFIYCFLVEKVHVIRSVPSTARMKSKLYLFNCIGVLIPFIGVIVLNFVYRIHRFRKGTCIIGMERVVILPLIMYDLVINVWLTSLFVVPLQQLYSYKNNPNSRLRTVAIRAFLGSCFALTSSIVNLSVIAALRGEPAWVCLMCCNSDILFNTIVVHWVTSKDQQSYISSDTSDAVNSKPETESPSSHNRKSLNTNTTKALIVTNISANHARHGNADETDPSATRGPNNDPRLSVIKVRTDHVREEVLEVVWNGCSRSNDDGLASPSWGSSKDLERLEPSRLGI